MVRRLDVIGEDGIDTERPLFGVPSSPQPRSRRLVSKISRGLEHYREKVRTAGNMRAKLMGHGGPGSCRNPPYRF